jgi:hypothetical protein
MHHHTHRGRRGLNLMVDQLKLLQMQSVPIVTKVEFLHMTVNAPL